MVGSLLQLHDSMGTFEGAGGVGGLNQGNMYVIGLRNLDKGHQWNLQKVTNKIGLKYLNSR